MNRSLITNDFFSISFLFVCLFVYIEIYVRTVVHIYCVCIKIIEYMPSNYVIYTLPRVYIEYNCLNIVGLYRPRKTQHVQKPASHTYRNTVGTTYIDIYRCIYIYSVICL